MSALGRNQLVLSVALSCTLAVGFFAGGLSQFVNAQPVPVPGMNDPSQPDQIPAQGEPPLKPFVFKRIETKTTAEKTAPATFNFPTTVKQGEVLKVELKNVSNMVLGTNDYAYATLAGHKARFFTQPGGDLLALVPVSVYEKPASLPLTIYNAAGVPIKTASIAIQDAHYKIQNITVSKTTAGLKPLPGELEAIQSLKDTISPVRYWTAPPFLSPTVDCQNSPFGVKRYHNGISIDDYHKGVDLRSSAGRPIRAITDGRVQIATMYRLHGGTVGLDHGQGIGSIYIHMSKLAVKQGEMVKKGQTIGYVGSTGFASGPHLHWGLYVSGLPVSPNQWTVAVPKCN